MLRVGVKITTKTMGNLYEVKSTGFGDKWNLYEILGRKKYAWFPIFSSLLIVHEFFPSLLSANGAFNSQHAYRLEEQLSSCVWRQRHIWSRRSSEEAIEENEDFCAYVAFRRRCLTNS